VCFFERDTKSRRLRPISKLKGEIVAAQDPKKSRSLLIDRFKSFLSKEQLKMHPSLKPIFRLDYEAEGLCLITNSGDLAKALVSDAHSYPIRFRARVHGLITESKLSGLRKGLHLDGKRCFRNRSNDIHSSLLQERSTFRWKYLYRTLQAPSPG
jgi:16S rRNA U516 pseudouridylate synthase RsuA-like enzyme